MFLIVIDKCGMETFPNYPSAFRDQSNHRYSGLTQISGEVDDLSLIQTTKPIHFYYNPQLKMTDAVLTSSSIDGLPKIAEGKVRDLYEVDEKTLLFVASDRISAYDVIMKNVFHPIL